MARYQNAFCFPRIVWTTLTFVAQTLAATSTTVASEYILGLGAKCTSDAGYESIPLEADLPPLLQFLVGSEIESLQFLAVTIGTDVRPGSSGEVHVRRPSFGLKLTKPKGTPGKLTLTGTIEIFQPVPFCEILRNGLSAELVADGQSIARLRLAIERTEGIVETEDAKKETLDRIGRRYFNSFRYFLGNDFRWYMDSWQPANRNPFDLSAQPEDWRTRQKQNDCQTTDPRIVNQGEVRLQEQSGPNPICAYFDRVDAVESLLSFIQATGLYLSEFAATPAAFRLSQMPFYIRPFGTNCVVLTLASSPDEEPLIEFCERQRRLTLVKERWSSRERIFIHNGEIDGPPEWQ